MINARHHVRRTASVIAHGTVAIALCVTVASPASAGADGVTAQPKGTNRLVSARTDGQSGQGESLNSSISGDGRFVTFDSDAHGLVAGEPTETGEAGSRYRQIYVRDRTTGVTTRVSRTPAGVPGNGDSFLASISADGRYVAYSSHATNLVDGVDGVKANIFRLDLTTMQTVRVTWTFDGLPLAFDCVGPQLSADGNLITYVTWSNNIVEDDNNRSSDVFLYNLATEETTLVSHSIDGGGTADDYSSLGRISSDGSTVAFASKAKDIVKGHSHTQDVVLFDVASGVNRLLTQGNSSSYVGGISEHGERVVFDSYATNLVAGVDVPQQAYFVDVATGAISLLSVGTDGEPADRSCNGTRISGDGTVMTFVSWATNIVPGGSDGDFQVFVRNVIREKTVQLSRGPGKAHRPGNGDSMIPEMAADGSVVAYQTKATNLVAGDHDTQSDVVAYRLR